MTVKIDLHAGHFIGGGANRYLNETSENRAVLAECINLLSGYNCEVFDSTNNFKPQSKNLDNLCKSINEHNADIALSLHLDSFNGKASGTTGYNWDTRTKELSNLITANISKELGIKNRGYKEANYQVLRETNPLAILIECCYTDSEIDYQKWNAKKCAKAIVNALVSYYNLKPIKNNAPTKKTNSEIATEVINGKWGNGATRKKKLTDAGYDYNAIQKIVNQKLGVSAPKKKTNSEIATEVINGKWGNGATRKKKLTEAGYDYNAIQKIVNQRLL